MQAWVLWWNDGLDGNNPPLGVFSSKEKALQWLGDDEPIPNKYDELGRGWELKEFTIDVPQEP